MPSSAWTERRRVLRRPIVCQSKKKTAVDLNQPLVVTVTNSFSGVDGLWQTSLVNTSVWPRLGTSNIFAATLTDAIGQEWYCTIALTTGLIPIIATCHTSDGGPPDHDFFGSGPPWDGVVPSTLSALPMTLVPGLGAGQLDITITAP